MIPETLAPYRHISSTPISTTHASNLLSTYLSNSESHPHLHPDALITPTGVTFSSHGGPLGGVILHNLRRVAAGLRGEFLEVESTPEPEDGQDDNGWAQGQGRGRNGNGKFGAGKGRPSDGYRKTVNLSHGAGDGAGEAVAETANEGWQNMSEYEREEGAVEVGEVGDRNNFVRSEGIAEDVDMDGQATSGAQDEQAGAKRKAVVNKEARKKAKWEKKKSMQREREEAKKKKKKQKE
ncbi:hypothetical protein K491DRAFT_776473 [Lophiostoma macrostomum CBS 122681]|uniref:Uncharacterized protein n=1 Tax=Lophiostoma macrostomum CBS 122681 TaxID=1314788 RepID=A0A6A6TH69_9PLEO|nr:hypothetical protein K491DRAFT_776473 [Lophiostoma macrostomum CBS 122681]